MAKVRQTNERERDSASSRRLMLFLDVTQDILDASLREIAIRTVNSYRKSFEYLEVLRNDAFEKLDRVRRIIIRGLTPSRRRALNEVGLFHGPLLAKLQFLWDCIADGTIAHILKALNSILGSLAKIVSIVHAVKEFKEWIEIAIDRLGPAGDPIILNLGPLPTL